MKYHSVVLENIFILPEFILVVWAYLMQIQWQIYELSDCLIQSVKHLSHSCDDKVLHLVWNPKIYYQEHTPRICTELTKCSAQPFVTLFYSVGGGGYFFPMCCLVDGLLLKVHAWVLACWLHHILCCPSHLKADTWTPILYCSFA